MKGRKVFMPDSDNGRGPLTRAEWAESEIRKAILEGRLVAGERVNVATLTESLDVSPTPLREALQRLASTGLITMSPQKGAYVSELTAEDLIDIYEFRLLLEPAAAEKAANRVTPASRARIESAYEAIGTIHGHEFAAVIAREAAHRDFHVAIAENCGSPRLLRVLRELLDHSARHGVLTRDLLGDRPVIVEEHAAILEAALSGNGALVRDLVYEHINHTYQAALALIDQTHAEADASAALSRG